MNPRGIYYGKSYLQFNEKDKPKIVVKHIASIFNTIHNAKEAMCCLQKFTECEIRNYWNFRIEDEDV